MKLTAEEVQALDAAKADPEKFHAIADALICTRLSELDPEYFGEIMERAKGVPFWTA